MTSPAAAPQSTAPAVKTRSFGYRPVLSAALVPVVLAGAWWLTHPGAFPSESSGSQLSVPLPAAGHSVTVGMFVRPVGRTVTLVEVTPRVTVNTAEADVSVHICRDPQNAMPVGTAAAAAERVCGQVANVQGYRLPPMSGSASPTAQDADHHIVVEITPKSAGEDVVEGVELRYRDGLRWGKAASGVTLTLQTQR